MSRKLHELSSSRRRLSDESFNSHVNSSETRIFGLNYVFQKLEVGGNRLESKDNVYNSELAFTIEKNLRSQDLIELIEIHQALSLNGDLLI